MKDTCITKSAYDAHFWGTVQDDYTDFLWESWAPLKEKLFLWLALRKCCPDRLRRKGLCGLSVCLLCDQRPESVDHLMTSAQLLELFGSKFSLMAVSVLCTTGRDLLPSVVRQFAANQMKRGSGWLL
jgi:hypothetical protein